MRPLMDLVMNSKPSQKCLLPAVILRDWMQRSFVLQRDYRINFCRFTGGQQRSKKTRQNQHDNGGDSGGKVDFYLRQKTGVRNLPPHRADQFQHQYAQYQPCITSNGRDNDSLLHHHSHYGACGRTESFAQSDFSCAFFYGDQHNISNTNYARKYGSQCDKPAKGCNTREQTLHLLKNFFRIKAAKNSRIVRMNFMAFTQ